MKLPVTTTRAELGFTTPSVSLSSEGIKVNVTRNFHPEQVRSHDQVARRSGTGLRISVFAGRLGDYGHDYRPLMQDAVRARPQNQSNREIIGLRPGGLNIARPTRWFRYIITVPNDLLKKLPDLGTKSGADLSRMAVTAFRDDAKSYQG